MIVSDSPYLDSPQLRGFRAFLGFGDLPALDDHIKYGAKYKVSEMRTDKKLLARVPDFGTRWEQARAISGEVNAIGAEPEAASLVQRERALNGALSTSIVTIAREANRDKKSKATTDAVYRASDLLNEYVGGLANELQNVRNTVAARVRAQDEARRIAAEADAQKQRAAAETFRAEAAVQSVAATAREVQVAVDTRALVTEQVSTQKLIAKAQKDLETTRILGIPAVYWGVGAVAVAGGAFFYYRRKKRR